MGLKGLIAGQGKREKWLSWYKGWSVRWGKKSGKVCETIFQETMALTYLVQFLTVKNVLWTYTREHHCLDFITLLVASLVYIW